MASEWIDVTVADIASPQKNGLVGGPFGSNLVSKDYVPTGVPVIRGQNMGAGRWVEGPFVFVSPEKAVTLNANKARPGDLVFTQRGTLGQVALVPANSFNEYIVSQSQMKLTVNPSIADAMFVYYAFQSSAQQDYIRNNSVQTGVPHTNLGTLRNTPLLLPPLDEQKAISGLLGAFDTRLDALSIQNTLLEQIARTIFKSWFVDFDPVRAKAEGREPEGMDAVTAGLFPSKLEAIGDQLTPLGWGRKPLDEIADFLNGLPLQKFAASADEESLPAIKIAQLKRGTAEGADPVSRRLPPQYVVRDGDLIFSWSGSLEVAIWCGGQGALNQHLFKVTSETYPLWFVHGWLLDHLDSFREIAASKVTTMGHIQRHHLHDAVVSVPDSPTLQRLSEAMNPLFRRAVTCRLQARTLAELRDTLLPRLISGKLRVPEAEKLVESVL